jgi:FkbM family methyltransferase
MKTRDKVFLANLARRVVLGAYRLFGLDVPTKVRRMGINWDLDLDEGIDFAIYLLRAHERRTIASYRKVVRPGDIVLDIGANIGSHTLPLAARVGASGRVVGVEPTKFAMDKLRRNLALNPEFSDIVVPVQAMLSNSTEGAPPVTLPSSWPLDQSGDVHPEMRSVEQSTVGAEMLTVDALVSRLELPSVDFIKLDVDGYEVAVLEGAENVLRTHAPRIVMELAEYTLVERGRSLDELLEMLVGHGYRIFDEGLKAELPRSLEALRPSMKKGESMNVVLLPGNDPLARTSR